MKKLANILAGIFVPLAVATGFYFFPERIIDSDKGINKYRNGTLTYGIIRDENADGIADYLRVGVVSRPNGGEFKFPVSEKQQTEYQETYQKSKFSK